MIASILHDDFDRQKFLENSLGLVRGMRTLLDGFGMAEAQAIATILKHLEELMPLDEEHCKILRMYATWTIPLLCNVLWDQVDGEKAAASVEAVAMQAAQHLRGVVFRYTAEGFFRRLGAEKGVDFYAFRKATHRPEPRDS